MSRDRPFDAHEAYLCDRGEEHARWRTVSLVTAIRGILEGGRDFPAGSAKARLSAVRAVADELSRRGLDATALVRYGMWQRVSSVIVMGILAARVVPTIEIKPPVDMEGFDVDEWANVLDLPEFAMPSGDTDELIGYLGHAVAQMLNPIMSWMSTASLEELVLLRAPREIQVLAREDAERDRTLQERYGWAVDHFSKTFFYEWDTSSLHLAHRWLSGHDVPPCNAELMADRAIDGMQLDKEIARRAVWGRERLLREEITAIELGAVGGHTRQSIAAASARILEPGMIDHAKNLLHQGRHKEAAAIFEFAARGVPDDAGFHNNWGFCLIPVAPAEALEHLTYAAALGYSNPPLNIYNQMCCHVAENRTGLALQLAEKNWGAIRDRPCRSVTVWQRQRDNSWLLSEADNVCALIVELAIQSAVQERRANEEALWRARSEEV